MVGFNVFKKKEKEEDVAGTSSATYNPNEVQLDQLPKPLWKKVFPVLAAGSGLFSEGYVTSVIGSVGTMLGQIYQDAYSDSNTVSNVMSISFIGTVVGMVVFGYTSDHWSRRNSLLVSTIIMIVFTALSAGAFGAGGSLNGMIAALTAYRFLVGIGIGGEYPAGSVAAAESSGELKKGTRNMWFIMFTNAAIDWGFVVGAFVPYVLVLIFTENHLRAAWRVAIGLGVIPPISLLLMRLKLSDPEEFKRETMKRSGTPYWLVIKYYWPRLLTVGFIWFLYDFSVYSFGLYSAPILAVILGNKPPLFQVFGWNTVINLFYIPGATFGAFFSDWVGPRYALATGVFLQGLVGFIMAGLYNTLTQHVAAFAVVYGIFLTLGEVGPGDNIGLIASKTCATGVRGQYYGIAAAIGKIGAFVGTKVFPEIEKAGHNATQSAQYPFWVSSSFCMLTAAIALFCLPHIGQDTIVEEDLKFRAYLEKHGFDTSTLGLETVEAIPENGAIVTPPAEQEKL